MEVPDRIGDYEVIRALGSGDFAVVYEVTDGADPYALKLAHRSDFALLRLNTEGDALDQLDHPGVPRLISRGEHDGAPYLLMSLVGNAQTLKAGLDEQASRNSVYSDVETLEVVEGLLEILVHLKERGDLVHRDIKSANVMIRRTDLRPSLLDFGFAKAHGSSDIRSGDSFFRVGAARYCPPSKLDHPGRADRSHDVFAVGVLAYEMLTGRYPWSATATGDRDELRRAYQQRLIPTREIHPLVRPEVARFIESLLNLHDEHRPDVDAALETAAALRRTLQPRLPGNFSPSSTLSFPRVLRDPLYGDIRLTEYEWTVLNTPELQRLRWIRQLGFANLVYPGAEHSRLSHSVGTLFRVEQILRSIEEAEGTRFDPETRIMARLFALVHDVPHIAHGHTLEDELGLLVRHDQNEARIDRLVLSPSSTLGAVLQENEMGRNVRSLFDPSSTIAVQAGISDLVSGATGADVLDYIDRDALHCGLDHRIDSALLRQLRLHPGPGDQDPRVVSLLYSRHGPRIDREFAVESLFRERFAMFMKVYSHPRKLSAAAVLDKAVHEVLAPSVAKRSRLIEEELEQMPDDVLIEWLRTSARQNVSRCASMIRNRRLPRPVYRAPLLAPPGSPEAYQEMRIDLERRDLLTGDGRRQAEGSLARSARVNAEDVFIYLPLRAPGHKRLEHWVSEAEGREDRRDASHGPIADVRQAHLRLWEVWVYYEPSDPTDDQARARVASEAAGLFGRENRLNIPLREDRLF